MHSKKNTKYKFVSKNWEEILGNLGCILRFMFCDFFFLPAPLVLFMRYE